MNEDVAFINEQVDRHHAWFSKSLPMIASENVISPLAREMLLTDFGDRYAEGLPHERYYQESVFLFPTPLRDLRDAFQEAGCHVWYDGAHVMGLIAGGQFQDPLHEGADVLTGSTHKTLPGPQHGILLSDSEDEKFIKRLQRAVFPGVVSNHHLHAMAALGITLAEFLEFGRDYAAQIVRNAKALAQALHERGIKALAEKHGFTQSHAIALDVAALGGGAKVAGDLEKANIITNKNLLPWDTSSVKPSGIRLVHDAERRDVPRDRPDRPRPFVEGDQGVPSRQVRDRQDALGPVVVGFLQQLPDGRRAHDVPQDHVGLERFGAERIGDGHTLLRDLRPERRDVAVVVLVEHIPADQGGLADGTLPGHADLELDDIWGHLHLSVSSARLRADS